MEEKKTAAVSLDGENLDGVSGGFGNGTGFGGYTQANVTDLMCEKCFYRVSWEEVLPGDGSTCPKCGGRILPTKYLTGITNI